MEVTGERKFLLVKRLPREFTIFPRIIAGGDCPFFHIKGERLFEGGDYFKYFHHRGAIIQGRRLIEGHLLLKEIRYVVFALGKKNVNQRKHKIVCKHVVN